MMSQNPHEKNHHATAEEHSLCITYTLTTQNKASESPRVAKEITVAMCNPAEHSFRSGHTTARPTESHTHTPPSYQRTASGDLSWPRPLCSMIG